MEIGALLDRFVSGGHATGVAAAWGKGPHTRALRIAGRQEARGRLVTTGTRWDLASLTKVLATVPTVLRLVRSGRLKLDAPLADYVPRLRGTAAGSATIAQLLSHTGGLPAEPGEAASVDAALARPAVSEPGCTVLYSDVGYLALGAVIEDTSGMSLSDAFSEHVNLPLDLIGTTFGSSRSSMTSITTEGAREWGAQKTHDPAARRLGGVAGHAGMFSSLDDVVTLTGAWVRDTGWISPELRAASLRPRTLGLDNGRRGWGWSCAGDAYHCVGESWPETTVSHTGFTGTSVALDPVSGAWAILLTNGLPRNGDHTPIMRLRTAFHDAVASRLGPG